MSKKYTQIEYNIHGFVFNPISYATARAKECKEILKLLKAGFSITRYNEHYFEINNKVFNGYSTQDVLDIIAKDTTEYIESLENKKEKK